MSRRAAGGPSKGASNDEEESVEDKKVMNALIDQMRDLLPVSAAVKSNMNRETVVKAVKGYLYLRQLPWPLKSCEPTLPSSTVLQAMDHFILILDGSANVVYATENISTTFGYSQCQLFCQSIFEIIHPMDKRLIEILVSGATAAESTSLLTLRFEAKKSKRTVGFSLEENGQRYKMAVVQIFTMRGPQGASLLASGTVLDKNGYPDMQLHSFQCIFYTTMDLKLIHVSGMEPFLGKPWMVYAKKSLYLLVHPEDGHHVRVAHINARDHKDYEMETLCVRLICEDGSYTYVTLYFLYRRAMGNTEDTIKIIVTYYGKQHLNGQASAPAAIPNQF